MGRWFLGRQIRAAAGVLLALLMVAASAQSAAARPDDPGTFSRSPSGPSWETRLASTHFRLVVPFRTQKDGGRWQTSNCGPATLGMLLDGYGIVGQETDDLRFRMHTYQGTVGMRTGTGLEHVAQVAKDIGLTAHEMYTPDGSYRRWQVADIAEQLRLGRPVMPLVRLYLVPGYENLAPRWGHYILLTGIAPDGFYFSDSLKTDPGAGVSRVITEQQLAAAISASHIPGQAVAFSGPRDLPVWTP